MFSGHDCIDIWQVLILILKEIAFKIRIYMMTDWKDNGSKAMDEDLQSAVFTDRICIHVMTDFCILKHL